MPVFAFANAGVALHNISLGDVIGGVPLGIAAGLFIGKQIGVFGIVWVAVKTGLCKLPDGMSWMQIYGVSLLAGIGFTMSLFIGTLAFSDTEFAVAVRLGVLTGSTASGILGCFVLYYALRNREAKATGNEPSPTADLYHRTG
jgi:NhaA family Na+:H+ antiporter